MQARKFYKLLLGIIISLLYFVSSEFQSVSYSESATITKIKELAATGDTLAQAMLGEIYFDSLGVSQNLEQARYWFKKVAENGNFPNSSMTDYYYSMTVTADEKEANPISSWEKQAAEQGDPLEQYYLANEYWRAKEYPQALFWYQKAAEQGTRSAQSRVGLMYYEGKGTLQNYAQALSWFKRAAEQGDKLAQLTLGTMYFQGQGVPKDYTQALYWSEKAATSKPSYRGEPYYKDLNIYGFEEAAKKGSVLAQSALGIVYFYAGKQALQNAYQEYHKKLALSFFTKSAQHGFPLAYLEIGEMYERGDPPAAFLIEVPQDYHQAASWYRKGAERGLADAQLRLGVLYERGDGVPQDYTQALFWYQKAAEQGNTLAQCSLGEIHLLLEEDEKAFYWFKKAAEADIKEHEHWCAPLALSVMYYAGQAIPKDDEQANHWYKKAERVWRNGLFESLESDEHSELDSYLWH